MDTPTLAALAFAALLAFLLVALGAALASWSASRRSRSRNRVALAGEAEAEEILAEAGYRVVGRQVTGTWWMEVDGERVPVGVRADLVVERRRRRYIAEVKTGGRAPDPCHPPTRRQLLEYSLVFGGLPLLLVDVEARVVRQVGFPALLPGRVAGANGHAGA